MIVVLFRNILMGIGNRSEATVLIVVVIEGMIRRVGFTNQSYMWIVFVGCHGCSI